jgi:hypothetical protein
MNRPAGIAVFRAVASPSSNSVPLFCLWREKLGHIGIGKRFFHERSPRPPLSGLNPRLFPFRALSLSYDFRVTKKNASAPFDGCELPDIPHLQWKLRRTF